MSHWCYQCGKYPTEKEYEKCKEENHDVDLEDDYQPTRTELGLKPIVQSKGHNNSRSNEISIVEDLMEFLLKKKSKIVISSNDSNRVYASIHVNDHQETFEIDVRANKTLRWFKASYYKETREIHSDESFKQALDIIKGQAIHAKKPKTENIPKRISFDGCEFYYDLVSPDWKFVKITKDNIEFVNQNTGTPIFARSKNQSEQTSPNFLFDGNPIKEFCKFLKIEEFFGVHLITLFLSNIACPIPVIIGPQGSIKSSQSAFIKKVVDPSGKKKEEQLSHLTKKIDDLNIHINNNYLVAFDNISWITDEVSDTLCKAITGAGYSKRELYTNDDETILKFRGKIILNGITVNLDNGDLNERGIIYNSEIIDKKDRIGDEEAEKIFSKLLPDLLGQIFITIQQTMRIYESVKEEIKELPRMADFGISGEAISRVLGYEPNRFLEWYEAKINSGLEIQNETSPIIPFITEQKIDNQWIQVKDFFHRFNEYADLNHFDKGFRNFPKTSGRLRAYLTRVKPLLDQNNYKVEFKKNTEDNEFTKGSTLIRFSKKNVQSSLGDSQ
ncbi:MAG TPA: hypothetical protein VIH04_09655 [Nitrosarchaeum sp.]